MGAQLRTYRRRIRSVRSTQKITKAMELIAASRIQRAQTQMRAARPYVDELTRALAALGRTGSVQHPMLNGVDNPRRAGIVLITSDRGLAGGYNANAIKAANVLAEQIRSEGKEPVRFIIGRKGLAYYRFRRLEVAGSWTGFSERPTYLAARDATTAIIGALAATSDGEYDGGPGIDELYVVYTKFESMISQTAVTERIAPVGSIGAEDDSNADEPQPAYEFEPEPEQLIDALLPRYVSARIFSAMLQSATSESAARRRAMKSASDNASELIRLYTRLANQARQAEITQEISEIVGGADALASTGSEER